jgi:hypothetical protein
MKILHFNFVKFQHLTNILYFRSSIFSLVGNPVPNSNQYGSLAQMMRVYVGITTRSTDIDANNTYRVSKVLSVSI